MTTETDIDRLTAEMTRLGGIVSGLSTQVAVLIERNEQSAKNYDRFSSIVYTAAGGILLMAVTTTLFQTGAV